MIFSVIWTDTLRKAPDIKPAARTFVWIDHHCQRNQCLTNPAFKQRAEMLLSLQQQLSLPPGIHVRRELAQQLLNIAEEK